MGMPGDQRIIIDVPVPGNSERQATMTAGVVMGDGELSGNTRTWLLSPHEETELNMMIAGLLAVRLHEEAGL